MKRLIFSLIGLLMLGPSIMVYGSTAPDSVIYYYGFEDNLDSFSEENPQDSIEGIWYCDDDLNRAYFKDTIIRVSNVIEQSLIGWSNYSIEKEEKEISHLSASNSISTAVKDDNVFKVHLGVEGRLSIKLYGFTFEPNQLYRVSFLAKSTGKSYFLSDIIRGYAPAFETSPLPKTADANSPLSTKIGTSVGENLGGYRKDFELSKGWNEISLLFYYTGDAVMNSYLQNKGHQFTSFEPVTDEKRNKYTKSLQTDLFSFSFYCENTSGEEIEVCLDDITIERTDIPVANVLLDQDNKVIVNTGYEFEIENSKDNIVNQWSFNGSTNNDSFMVYPSTVENNSYVKSYYLHLGNEMNDKDIETLTLCYESDKANGAFALKITDEYFSGLISEDNYVPDFVIPITYGYNNGQTTDVPEIDSDKTKEQSVYYDLFGRRVENPQSGLYIKDGKKIFIK